MSKDRDETNVAEPATGPGQWEPKIIAFLCNWCSYVGADLAGTSRIEYPATMRIIRVPCTGRVDPVFIVKSLQSGADGVLVSGCHPGDCHYGQGNYYARRRMMMFRRLLEFVGIDPRRLQMSWVSASEGQKWADVVTAVTEEIRVVGPIRSRESARARDH
jgi:coenzyme F420-reducing hydrogenase delta subunit